MGVDNVTLSQFFPSKSSTFRIDVDTQIGKQIVPASTKLIGSPVILQVVGFKRYHDEDTRKDYYSLVLSDENSNKVDFDEIPSELTNQEEGVLTPSISHLIDKIKLLSIVKINQYWARPPSQNIEMLTKIQPFKPPFILRDAFLILDMEVIHTDFPHQIATTAIIDTYYTFYPYMLIEKRTVSGGPDWTKVSSSYEKWREGVGEYISNDPPSSANNKRKPTILLTKSMDDDFTEVEYSYLQADVNSFEKAELEYYASVNDDEPSARYSNIALCHQSAIGSSYTMQKCCDNTTGNTPDYKFIHLRELNPYYIRVWLRLQIAWKGPKIAYTLPYSRLGNVNREMFTLHLADPDDGYTMDCVVWNSPATYDRFQVGQIYKIRRPLIRIANKHFTNLASDYSISLNPDSQILLEEPTGPLVVESLSSICLKYIASYFSVTLYTRELLKENEQLPLYLSPQGKTPLDVLTMVPEDLLDTMINKHLGFFSIFEMYYSGKFPFITSTFYSMAIRKQEMGYCNMLTDRINHIRESNEPYAMLLPVYNHLNVFKSTKRDRDEIELPKFMTNDISDDRTYNVDKFPITGSLHDFRTRFYLFTGGLLEGLDWQNILCAGGSVLAALMDHIPEGIDTAEKISDYYLNSPYKNSDIDLFLWGENTNSAERVKHIYQVVTKNLYLRKKSFFIARSASVITIVTEYPYRHVQIVDRRSGSPSEILLGFDLDCVSVGFDGNQVWALPKAIRAITRKYNLPDPMRCDSTYEFRTMKYSNRGFCMAVPGLTPQSYIQDDSVLNRLVNISIKMMSTKKEDWEKEIKVETTSYAPNLLWGPLISVEDNLIHVMSSRIYQVYNSWSQLSKTLSIYSGSSIFHLRRARNFGFTDHPLLQPLKSLTQDEWKLVQ